MRVRRAEQKDAGAIWEIITEAQAYFRESGIPQWQDGYPNQNTVNEDIAGGLSYVLEDETGRVLGTSVLQFTPEPTYVEIYEGAWKTQGDGYAAIHRIALHPAAKGTGAAAILYEGLEQIARERGVPSIRVDTHRVNLPMQRYLKKHGFEECGIVHMQDEAERVAFEKLL